MLECFCGKSDVWMDGLRDGRISATTDSFSGKSDVLIDGWISVSLRWFFCCQVFGWMDGWMDGRTDGWMDGWIDGRMDG